MANPVTNGSLMQCSFGIAPAPLTVLPLHRVMSGNQPAANIMDNKPFINIPGFGMCNSATNPAVIAARAAALGAQVPGPCVPAIGAPWTPGSRKMMVGGAPALTNSCKCNCTWSGVISVTMSPAVTVNA